MSYDNGQVSSYTFAGHDFGTGSNITQVLAVPTNGPNSASPGTGRRGRVLGVTIHSITEDFLGGGSDSGVQVGDGSDADLYFDSGLVLDEAVDVAESVYLKDDGAQIDIEAGRTSITVTMVAGITTPTGIATVQIDILWFGPDGGQSNN